MWELCGVEGEVDVDRHCYEAMDRLLQRQDEIQKALARKHLRNGALVLYDITSSYFEGQYEDSELVAFGYNRDGKRGYEQMVKYPGAIECANIHWAYSVAMSTGPYSYETIDNAGADKYTGPRCFVIQRVLPLIFPSLVPRLHMNNYIHNS